MTRTALMEPSATNRELLVAAGGSVEVLLPGLAGESVASPWRFLFPVGNLKLKVEEKDKEFKGLTLVPDTYYPAMGAKRIVLTATWQGKPLADCQVTWRIIDRLDDDWIVPDTTDHTDSKGRVIFKLNAPKRPPSTPPTKYENKWKDPQDPKDKWQNLLEAEFTIHGPKGISNVVYRWKVLTNKNVNLRDVLDGKAVWTYVDLAMEPKLVPEDHEGKKYTVEDPTVSGAWNAPPQVLPGLPPKERSFNFAQFMLNEVVPRKRTIAGTYVFLHEDGLYGEKTAKALHKFKDAVNGFNLGRNTKTKFTARTGGGVTYDKDDDNTSVSFRKMTKDYYLRDPQDIANTAGKWLDRIIDKDTLVVKKYEATDVKVNDAIDVTDTGLWELYDNVVKKFTEAMLGMAAEYATGSAHSWIDRVNQEHYPGDGISYCWDGKQTLGAFNATVTGCKPPGYNLVSKNYSGNVNTDCSLSSTGTLRYPGLRKVEFDKAGTHPQYQIKYWSGIDCSGFVQRCVNYATVLFPSYNLDVRVPQLVGADGHGNEAALVGSWGFFDSSRSARYYLSSKKNNSISGSDWEVGPRRGDIVGYNGHITMVWKNADEHGKYQIIHAAGQDKWRSSPNSPATSGWRKVTRMPQNYGHAAYYGRVILWD